ncbi:MAG: TIGR03118 family protein [Candidatus Acidiferrales bacterium]
MIAHNHRVAGAVTRPGSAPLNQPWGFAVAPKNFGEFSNTLLVSNNTNTGTINAFNAITGQFVGTLKDVNDDVIKINQLWGIRFGGGAAADGATNQLFFTAGPDPNNVGIFGVINLK